VIDVLEADDGHLDARELASRTDAGIWPLLSHHSFNPHGLLRADGTARLADEALSLLLVHDGLAIADPLVEVREAVRRGDDPGAVKKFSQMLMLYAQLEPLFDAGVLAVEEVRPSLAAPDRAAVLAHFGIDTDMSVFTNFDQVLSGFSELSADGQHQVLRRSEELVERLGLQRPSLTTADAARATIKTVWQALVHLSWQIAVCNEDPDVDLVLLGGFEEALFRELVLSSGAVAPDVSSTRHRTDLVGAASLGGIPNVRGLDLTVEDAVSIRRDDSFELFRKHLRAALRENQAAVGGDRYASELATSRFEERMTDAAAELSARVSKRSFRGHIRENAVPAGIAVVASAIASGATESGSAGLAVAVGAGVAAGVTAAAEVVNGWAQARNKQNPRQIAVRYAATLGRPSPR
jgi:hypothetical protein